MQKDGQSSELSAASKKNKVKVVNNIKTTNFNTIANNSEMTLKIQQAINLR